jgi:SH3-like domain-containing protein
MFVLVLLIVISILSGIFEKNYHKNERPAIIFAEQTSVKNEPRNSGSEVFVLHEGTKVFVLEDLENWRKIELTDGTVGWIEVNVLKEIK